MNVSLQNTIQWEIDASVKVAGNIKIKKTWNETDNTVRHGCSFVCFLGHFKSTESDHIILRRDLSLFWNVQEELNWIANSAVSWKMRWTPRESGAVSRILSDTVMLEKNFWNIMTNNMQNRYNSITW